MLVLIKVSNDGTRKSSAKVRVTAREMSGDQWERPLQETRKRHNFSLDFKTHNELEDLMDRRSYFQIFRPAPETFTYQFQS